MFGLLDYRGWPLRVHSRRREDDGEERGHAECDERPDDDRLRWMATLPPTPTPFPIMSMTGNYASRPAGSAAQNLHCQVPEGASSV
jgi:hypothetical protein